jgi:hypothetical protein
MCRENKRHLCLYLAMSRAEPGRAEESPTQKNQAQARPGPARPNTHQAHQAVGPRARP